MHPWLHRLHHDLVKRLLWTARDCAETGTNPLPGELVIDLLDEEGHSISPRALYEKLADEVPDGVDLTPFTEAFEASLRAAEANDVPGVLRLQKAYDDLRSQVPLASSLKGRS
ncbi:MAG: hypothetical protein JW940_09380 [Polyangiaceae bacterium]|nr:hypothetical protein [Polyangiaceae bacterium]